MSRSFISYDQPDGMGVRAQVSVRIIAAPIASLEEREKSVKVVFDHKAMGLAKPVYGWTGFNSPVHVAAQAAAGTGREVNARLETSRKPGKSRKKALFAVTEEGKAQLAFEGDEVRALCVSIEDAVSDEILTDPNEDIRWKGLGRSDAPPFLEPADSGSPVDKDHVLKTLAEARKYGVSPEIQGALGAAALLAGATPSEVQPKAAKSSNSGSVSARHSSEAKGWDTINSDGRPNLGSYEISQTLRLVDRVRRVLKETLPDSDPKDRDDQAVAISPVLIECVDKIQVAAYGGGRRDRMARSWGVAAAAMWSWIDSHPLPFGKTSEERTEWEESLVADVATRIRDVAEYIHGDGCMGPPVAVQQADTAATHPAPAQSTASDVSRPATDAPAASVVAGSADDAPVDDVPASQPQSEHLDPAKSQPVATPDQASPSDAHDEPELIQLVSDIARLVTQSGMSPAPDGPWIQLIRQQFAVTQTREVPVEMLRAVVNTYGSDPSAFAQWVNSKLPQAA